MWMSIAPWRLPCCWAGWLEAWPVRGGQSYSLALWAGAYLVEAVPGIVLHLLLVPALVAALTRAGLIPPRSLGKRPDKEAAV